MRLLAALLFFLTAASAHAQTVTFLACNPGSVAVDVYFVQGANVIAQHVEPAECFTMAHSKGAMAPGLVAVGFVNAQGKWGGVHRTERLPGFGNRVAERTTELISVTRGGTRLSIPAQFNFKPPTPNCHSTTPSSPSYVANLPLSATWSEIRQAQRMDAINAYGSTTTTGTTRCDDFAYDLNVLAFADTSEAAFLRFCEPCDQALEAQKTLEQRAAEKQAVQEAAQALLRRAAEIGLLELPGVGLKAAENAAREEREARYREILERDSAKWDRIGWSDVPRYKSEVFSNEDLKGSAAIIQATIAGVKLPNPAARNPNTEVYFKEAPDREFIMCALTPDILADVFGPDFATAMIGKTVEVEGLVTHCETGIGILIKLQHQIKLVGSGQGMVPAVTPPPFKFPDAQTR